MKRISCDGTPSEIGLKHGKEAKTEVERGLRFYSKLFEETAKLSWPDVCDVATRFEPLLRQRWPNYVEEMKGVASGAGVPYISILALNVRTEIAYGLSRDGCTALYWRSEPSAFLAQNWDWQEEQQENLINLSISQEHRPTIDMVTEAGIIGKIGLNSKGLGVCLNAIRALGVDFQRLPCHLALRTCLESSSVQEAVATLQESQVASACHILVADSREAIGLECSHMDIVELPTNEILTHTNHFVKSHPVEDKTAFVDSPVRLRRINELIHERGEELGGTKTLTTESIRILLEDTANSPTAICRSQTKDSTVATLFNIVMNLTTPSAEVIIGKPTQHGAEIMYLTPQTSSQTFGDHAWMRKETTHTPRLDTHSDGSKIEIRTS